VETGESACSIAPMATTHRPRFTLALLGAACAILAPVAYMATVSTPVGGRTGWAMFTTIAAGLTLVLAALLSDRRKRTIAAAALAAFFALAWTAMFFIALKTPPTSALATAPDFTLLDEGGHPVSLAQERAKGPVLLVFYRGWW
jgi:hypothetical protein